METIAQAIIRTTRELELSGFELTADRTDAISRFAVANRVADLAEAAQPNASGLVIDEIWLDTFTSLNT